MDYMEIAKRLRNYEWERDDDGKCLGCPDEESYYPCCVDCFSRTHRQAADAIEQLDKDLERAKEWASFWEEEANEALKKFQVAVASKPRWIPVTEALPKPTFAREWYLVSLESGCVKTLAFEKKGRTDNLFRPGWHETVSPVTHWMPLPAPPKEEAE